MAAVNRKGETTAIENDTAPGPSRGFIDRPHLYGGMRPQVLCGEACREQGRLALARPGAGRSYTRDAPIRLSALVRSKLPTKCPPNVFGKRQITEGSQELAIKRQLAPETQRGLWRRRKNSVPELGKRGLFGCDMAQRCQWPPAHSLTC